MDTDDFFGFDTTGPDVGLESDREDDADFDALNEETFGNAANTGDWEGQHRQLSGLCDDDDSRSKKSELLERSGVSIPGCIGGTDSESSLFDSLNSGLSGIQLRNSSTIPLPSFNTPPKTSSLIDPVALSESPGNSIWAPEPGLLEKLNGTNSRSNTPSIGAQNFFLLQQQQQQASVAKQQQMSSFLKTTNPLHPYGIGGSGPNVNLHHQRHEQLGNMSAEGIRPSVGFPLGLGGGNVKSVADLEMELKLQQLKKNASERPVHQQVFRAEDLERQSRTNQMNQNVGRPIQSQMYVNQAHQQVHAHQQQQQQRMPYDMDQQARNLVQSVRLAQVHPLTGQILNSGGNMSRHPLHQNAAQLQYMQQQQQHLLNNMVNKHQGPPPVGPGFLPANHRYNSVPSHLQNFPNNQRNYNDHRNNFGGNRHNSGFSDNDYDRRRRDAYGRNDRGYDQRQEYNNGGGRVRRDSEAEWEEWERKREIDPYAGLMTPKQKKWLMNIQTIQLQTDNPYRDDYYYVMMQAKKRRPNADAPLLVEGLSKLLPVLPQPGKESEKTYQPPAMENSLGKLQVASVNAPRKIMEIASMRQDSKCNSKDVKERRTYRLILLTVEGLYRDLAELEDLERKISILPDSPTRDEFSKRSKQLANSMWLDVTKSKSSMIDILSIKKGKTLVAGLVERLGPNAAEKMLTETLTNLPKLTLNSEPDQRYTLNILWPAADKLLASASAEVLVNLATALIPHLSKEKSGKDISLDPILSSKFGISVVVGMLVQGERIHSDVTKHPIWQDFLAKVISLFGGINDYKPITNTLVRDGAEGKVAKTTPSVTVLSRGQSLSSLKLRQNNSGPGPANGRLTPPFPLANPLQTAQPGAHLARCTEIVKSDQLAAAQNTLRNLENGSQEKAPISSEKS